MYVEPNILIMKQTIFMMLAVMAITTALAVNSRIENKTISRDSVKVDTVYVPQIVDTLATGPQL